MEVAVTWIFISAAIALLIAISSATDVSFQCQRRAFTCQDHAIRVMYLDLVYQWRQIADESEELEIAKLKGTDERRP